MKVAICLLATMLLNATLVCAEVHIGNIKIKDDGKIVFSDNSEQGTATQQGPQGPKGNDGPQGPKGDPGVVDKAAMCQVYADENLPAPPFCGKKIIFVTSKDFDGKLQVDGFDALDSADLKCQAAADAGGLSGIFKAWLSSSAIGARDRLTHSPAPYVRTDGTIVALHWLDLIDGWLKDPIICDEYNNCSPDPVMVWTGTDRVGRQASASSGEHCGTWNYSDFSHRATFGWAGEINSKWTRDPDGPVFDSASCNSRLRLYCIQQ